MYYPGSIMKFMNMLIYSYMYFHNSDLSGGHTPSILSAMRSAIDTSRAAHFNKEEFRTGDVRDCENAISHHHAFYMATLGGAKGQSSYWRASEASETLSGLFNRELRIYIIYI